MEEIRGYLLAVTAAAVLCGIVTALMGDRGSVGAMGKLLAGIFLSLTVVSPLGRVSLDGIQDYFEGITADAGDAVEAGTQMALEERNRRIIESTRAYILDKAAELNLQLTVEVVLSDDEIPAPNRVILTGAASPYARSELQRIIREDLGIAGEDQIWIT